MHCANEMTSFCIKCNTGLKWVKDMSIGLFRTQYNIYVFFTSISLFVRNLFNFILCQKIFTSTHLYICDPNAKSYDHENIEKQLGVHT